MFFDSERIAERKIQEALDEGVFENLPGKGKPLELDDSPLEVRILKNAGVPPDWILLAKEVEQTRVHASRLWTRLEREYARRRALADVPPPGTDPAEQRRRFTRWH